MSFWSSQTLMSRLPSLIVPYNESRIESASYTLSLGEEVYISALPDTPQKERKKFLLKERETIAIPPGQFAFLITHEKVTIPKNAIAFISVRFSIKAKGIVNVSGFHVDPGYSGRLIFAVYNAGPLYYQVEYQEQLFSIWFADLDNFDERTRKKPGFDSIPTSLTNSPDLVSSLPSLVKRMEDLEKKVESYTIKQAVVWAVTIAVILSLAKPLTDKILDFLPRYGNNKSEFIKPNSVNHTTRRIEP